MIRKILSILLVAILLLNHLSFSFYDGGFVHVNAIDEETSSNTKPSVSPEATPSTTPENSPSVSPEVTPSTTPENSPSVSPEVTPSTTPENSPSVSPEVTPSTTPETSPTTTPEVTIDPTLDEEESNFNEDENDELLLEDELNALKASKPANATYGDFELIMPTDVYMHNGSDLGDGVVEDINTIIYVKLDNTGMTEDLYYNIEVIDENEDVIRSEIVPFKYMWSYNDIPWDGGVEFPVHLAEIGNVPPGATVKVTDIAVSGSITDQYNSKKTWNTAKVGAYLTHLIDKDGNDISDKIEAYEKRNPIELSVGGIVIIKFMSKGDTIPEDLYYQTPSDKTLVSPENYYEGGYKNYPYLDKLLNSINVFSYDDIEGTHIVGPIVAKNEVYYKRENPVSSLKSNTKLIFADYSRGVPSYIGNLSSRYDGGRASAVNYDFDRTKATKDGTTFEVPNLFTSTSTKLINNGTQHWLQEFVVLEDHTTFISPNDSGNKPILHNDNYVNFEEIQAKILAESKQLLIDGSIENFDMLDMEYDSRTDGSVLKVRPGENWVIKNADNLEQIDIVLPPDYDYFHTASPDPLTINFECDVINPTQMGGKMVSRFPLVTLNGKEFENEGSGETVEFNEFGNKLIYNMPNIITDEDGNNRIVTYSTSQNIPGHLIMPQAEFWNYYVNTHGALTWEGGNINGLVLAKDVHLGEIEVHMWAYGGKEAKFATYTLNATKTVNGLLPYDHFVFKLDVKSVNPINGLYTSGFPLYAESDLNGNIQFQNIVFTEAGTYTFELKEMLTNQPLDMQYDTSVYQIVIEVTEVVTANNVITLKTDTTITKIFNSIGQRSSELVNDIHYNNINTTRILPSTGGYGLMINYLFGMICILLGSIIYVFEIKKKTKNLRG